MITFACMKLLLVFSSVAEASGILAWLQTGEEMNETIQGFTLSMPYSIQSYKIDGMDIDVLIGGQTHYELCFHVTRILSIKRYHLALFIGQAVSHEATIPMGACVNVINDKPIEIGYETDNKFTDAYSAGWLQIDMYPHQMGAYVNKTNSYFNAFLDFKKVASATCTRLNYSNTEIHNAIKQGDKCHIHSHNGIGFVYPCLYVKQAFYQLRIIVNEFGTPHYDIEKAYSVAYPTLIKLLTNIS